MNNEGAQNEELIDMLKMLGGTNDLESQITLAYMYFHGEGIDKNLDMSLFWCNLVLVHDECDDETRLEIEFRIGKIYLDQKRYTEGLNHLTELYEKCKNDRILIYIADAHFALGDGKDVEIYESLTTKQLDNDDIKYINGRLGYIYMTRRDFSKAIIWLTKSEMNSYTLNNLGFANEMLKNFSQAHNYYLQSAEKNYAFANLNLGYLYDNGLGVEKDTDKAFLYYEKGSDELEEWKLSDIYIIIIYKCPITAKTIKNY